jgi:hypothetical protein
MTLVASATFSFADSSPSFSDLVFFGPPFDVVGAVGFLALHDPIARVEELVLPASGWSFGSSRALRVTTVAGEQVLILETAFFTASA